MTASRPSRRWWRARPSARSPRERGRWCGSSRPSPYRPGRNRPSGCCSTNCRRPPLPRAPRRAPPRQRPRPVRRATADPLRDPAVRLCPRHDGPAHARHLRGPAVRAVHGRHAGAGPALERGPRPGRQAAPRGPQHGGRPCAAHGRALAGPRAGEGPVVTPGLLGYVLPHSQRRWVLDQPPPAKPELLATVNGREAPLPRAEP